MRTSLFDIDNWKEIGSTLARNKTRTFLTAFGIFWGTAMLAMLMGGARGLQDILSRNFEGFASNTALIFPGRTSISYKGYNKGTSYNLQQADVDGILLSVPEITALTSVYSVNVVASNGKFSTSCNLFLLRIVLSMKGLSKAASLWERNTGVSYEIDR